MNKDVIYIEPEDDITDIIAKIENSAERIVALVPPRKAGVFRSIVNIKLIAKSGAAKEKTVVLVTTDPSIIKLAAAVRMPVTKNLQSAPVIPTEKVVESEAETTEVIEITDNTSGVAEENTELESESEQKAEQQEDALQDNNTDTDKTVDSNDIPKKQKKQKLKKDRSGNWFVSHKKIVIGGGIGAVALVGVLVWALVFAPAVTVEISVQSEQKNFSENATFVTTLAEEKAEEGKFYVEQKKTETVNEVTFDATGQRNDGEKASGSVIVSAYFKGSGAIAINAGSVFSVGGLSFVSTEDMTLSWNEEDEGACENAGSLVRSGCQISGSVRVVAAEAGSKYNIAATSAGWSAAAAVNVYSNTAMTGGTDNIVNVVQQSDIENAKAKLASSSNDSNKEKLLATVNKDFVAIDSSFKQEDSAATSTPAVGEVVDSGAKPTLKVTTTSTIYVIDKTKMIQFISKKADLESDQKIYEVNDPRVENFSAADGGYIGKIKTTYSKGPSLVDSDIMEKIRGKGIGDAQYELRRIGGVSDVKITTSYPWVTQVPNDSNKITIHTDLKDSTSKDKQDSAPKDDNK